MGLLTLIPFKGSSPPFSDTYSTSFDGVSAYVTMGNVSSLNPSISTPFSISLWVKRVSGTGILVGKVDSVGSGLHGFYLSYDNTSPNFYIGQLSSYLQVVPASITTPAAGSWHLWGVTYDGSGAYTGVTFYLDGTSSPATSAASGSGSTANTADFRVSGYVGGLLSANLIDELAFWNKKLSAADMLAIYNSGTPTNLLAHPSAANLQNWWRMGDGDTYPTLTDVVAGANGTMTNMNAGDIVADVP